MLKTTTESFVKTELQRSFYWLTPWNKVLIEEPTVAQLVKKFPTFMKRKVPNDRIR